MKGQECVQVVSAAGEEHGCAKRQENPEGRKDGGDLGDDKEEPGTIGKQAYFALGTLAPWRGFDWDVFQAQPRAEVM